MVNCGQLELDMALKASNYNVDPYMLTVHAVERCVQRRIRALTIYDATRAFAPPPPGFWERRWHTGRGIIVVKGDGPMILAVYELDVWDDCELARFDEAALLGEFWLQGGLAWPRVIIGRAAMRT